MDLLWFFANIGVVNPSIDFVTIGAQIANGAISLWNKKSLINAKTFMTKKFSDLEKRLHTIEGKELTIERVEVIIENILHEKTKGLELQIEAIKESRKRQTELNDKLFTEVNKLSVSTGKIESGLEYQQKILDRISNKLP